MSDIVNKLWGFCHTLRHGHSKRKDTGESGRFRRFHISEIRDRQYKLDITWLRDESLEDSDELPEPQDLASEAITELEAVVDDLREIAALVERKRSWRHDESAADESSARLCRPGSVLVVVRSGILKHTLPVAITSVKSRVPSPINVGQRFPVERRIG